MRSLIGSRVARLEDPPLLRGQGRYVDDIPVSEVLHAAFVRSPHAHALITGVSTAVAAALPGVRAVLTLDDLAPAMAQRRMARVSYSGTALGKAWPYALAEREVSYVGEAVAMVLAESRYVAEDAVALVEVTYEVLPCIADCRGANTPGAPPVRRELSSNVLTAYKVGYGVSSRGAHIPH
jgi:carbon-monoxide dehydrogenase large subunit